MTALFKRFVNLVLSIGIILLLSGCLATGRYSDRHDSAPLRKPTPEELKDAQPTFEPVDLSRSRPYQVYGKSYTPLTSSDNFSEKGTASWYGRKFHGHLTANGEVYDMFAMSAAHKHLPLPSYVKVTNLSNNKHVIVRVNDRGPFHNNRVIDLSYSAAYKLGMLKTGTAEVKIEALPRKQVMHARTNTSKVKDDTLSQVAATQIPQADAVPKVPKKINKQYFVQVFASQSEQKAKDTAKAIASLYQLPAISQTHDGLFRVRIGPLDAEHKAQKITQQLKLNGYEHAFMLYSVN
ncbi:septal ring lytic transglycosylase RlpA family protein [Flocculibacter collagenilyticus]|uniref:septal ring lytic transglycosylase RlpA family protein n=1 Tax=Flocculibacter collagenilyticus TaxID=2744479 RepID=UPI0018F29302|nr:septal ring lytic transglycosylase RlpA family protein [Flocculibacter collagenilyticus]